MKEGWETYVLILCDAAQMFGGDCNGDITRHDCATAERPHDRDEDITRVDGIAGQLTILRLRDEPLLGPRELVLHCVVDAKHSDTIVHKLAV